MEQRWFLEKINKIDESFANLTKRINNQINKRRYEKENITMDTR